MSVKEEHEAAAHRALRILTYYMIEHPKSVVLVSLPYKEGVNMFEMRVQSPERTLIGCGTDIQDALGQITTTIALECDYVFE